MGNKLERHQHDQRDYRNGRCVASARCDACGKPVGTAYYTDDEVCGGGDGPGFYLCERKRCGEKLRGLTVDERRTVYERTRASFDAASARS